MKDRKKHLLSSLVDKYNSTRRNFNSYLRLQLLAITGICLIISVITVAFTVKILKYNDFGRITYIDYTNSMNSIDRLSTNLSSQLVNGNFSLENKVHIEEIINKYNMNYNLNIMITDLDGNILISVGDNPSVKVDIHKLIRDILHSRIDTSLYQRKVFYTFYPINFKDVKTYLIVSSIPTPEVKYKYSENILGAGLLLGTITFIAFFLFLTKKAVSYIEEISSGLMEIAKGDLDYKVPVRGGNELSLLAQNINHMESELKIKIAKEREAEITKNQLITNVSHDLRTPLTSIIGYLNLVKDGKYSTEEELKEYSTIAFNRAEKLKVLIDDLFEYTKLTNKGIDLNESSIRLNGMLKQLVDEMIVMADDNNVTLSLHVPNEPVIVKLDGDKMVRVFENLISNSIKYSMKPSIVHIKLYNHMDHVLLSVTNKADTIDPSELTKIFDRFYRLEKSRNSSKGGSGLGLSICKSIVKLHGGNIWAESKNQYVTFNIKLPKGRS
ncbi:MAG: HAMP domain-containing histidine kinase [Anaeromicrobium sp.]|uniref:HAMP domain-containing sensor histidine kinase n=1 Tax=Anaeromicrobium sp. TaxID=1929132 RepID=UPI0025E3A958|nr:HAMP domain-containing sensor histidine kinase [Anaeromicrobium sp.]MCT4594405.1 HAMP domain-containing histidine kinase [Anaeromicrobium sp.]